MTKEVSKAARTKALRTTAPTSLKQSEDMRQRRHFLAQTALREEVAALKATILSYEADKAAMREDIGTLRERNTQANRIAEEHKKRADMAEVNLTEAHRTSNRLAGELAMLREVCGLPNLPVADVMDFHSPWYRTRAIGDI